MSSAPTPPSRAHTGQPINRLLVISFVLIALVPLALLGFKLYRAAWDEAWREIREKHQLLAQNLASPIRIYVRDHQRALHMIGSMIHTVDEQAAGSAHNRRLMQELGANMGDFDTLALLDTQGRLRIITPASGKQDLSSAYAEDNCFRRTLATGEPQVSGATVSPVTGRPTLIVSQPILDRSQQLVGVLLGELRIEPIERLRRNIRFGVKGHSAIVDQHGHVIAHPNPAWMKSLRDLSGLSVVQKMMQGETGVTEFYSPFVKAQMVAGYTAVPDIGWGVMVPQPKSEVQDQVNRLLTSQLSWALAGLALAGVLAVALARWITRPLNRLAGSARELTQQDYQGTIADVPERAPREVAELGRAMQAMVGGLQHSREQISGLNRSLQYRVDEATAALQQTNERLSDALQRSDEFLSFARHDLRKPICVITDVSENLQQDLNKGTASARDVEQALELIAQSSRYMQRLTDDFLGQDVAFNSLHMSRRPVQLNDIVRLTVDSNRAYAERKQISLGTRLEAGLPTVEADDARMAQVLHNLVDNALKFARQEDMVVITTRSDGNSVMIEVSDTGPGLSPNDLPKVFTKHSVLSNRPTGGEHSTGLGLAICKAIVEQHGGNIGVRNNRESGCTFWVRMPLAERVCADDPGATLEVQSS